MKKNKKLIIGLILFLIAAGVAAWYFFFRTPTAQAKEDVGGVPDAGSILQELSKEEVDVPEEQAPQGSLEVMGQQASTASSALVTTDTVFLNAITAAKTDVTNNNLLTSIQELYVKNIIDADVTKNKVAILAEAASGKDIVQLILTDAQKIYLSTYGLVVRLTTVARATAGK